MQWKWLAGLALLVYILGTTPTVEGQCAITSATIQLLTADPTPELSNRGSLLLVIGGITTGTRATSVTWTRDGTALSNMRPVPGVPGSRIFIGGGEAAPGSGTSCETMMFQVALLVQGLLPGVYQYTATNDQTTLMSATYTLQDPGPPTNLTVTQISGRRLQVAWTAPASGLSGISYRYYIDTTDFINGGTTTTETSIPIIGPLNFGNTFLIHVRATTGTYLSVPATSPTVTVLNISPPTVTAPSVTADSATLMLSQPSNSLPSDMYSATLTDTTCSAPAALVRTGSTTSNTVTISDLDAGIRYTVSVTVSNTLAVLTSTAGTTTLTTSETAPSASPGVPTASAVEATSITLTWTVIPCLDRNGMITSYMIQYGSTQDRTNNTQSSSNSHPVTGLKPFTQYTFTVAGVNSIDTGPTSAASDLIRTAEARPTGVRNLAGEARLFSVILTWLVPEPLNGMLSNYTIQYRVNGDTITSTTTQTTLTIANLNPNTVVSGITVSATTGAGEGPAEMVQSVTTRDRPAMVQSVVVEVLTGTSVRVSWDNSGFQGITDFVVYYMQTGNRRRQAEMMKSVPASDSSVDIDELVSGKQYTFEVLARARVGGMTVDGPRTMSNPVIVMTTSTPGPPGTSPVAAIAGGIIAVLAIAALVAFISFLVWLYKTGRLSRILCCMSDSPKAGDVSGYRYAPSHNTPQQSDDHYYGNVDSSYPPQVDEFPEHTTATEGEEVSFKVVVSGKPAPSLVWKCGGEDLFSNYSMKVGDDGTLTFLSSEVGQSGVYVLVAENSAGKVEREVKLQVEREGEETAPDLSKQSLDIKAIPVDVFGEYVAGNHSSNNRGFRDQFQGLYDGEDKTKTVGLSAEFKKLNRFANITVYDDNRIELMPLPGHENCQGPFINACYIDGFSRSKKFIASQGPIPRTLVDFWRMIWQEKTPIIVMVTNLKEGNKNKCQQYWPDTGSATYGPFKVMITENVVLADYVIRTLQVSLEGGNRPFKLTQFHFIAWPDHGVPDYATPMLAFHRRVLSSHKGKKGPILVHCSAGVGRTGTFICIDNILEQIKKESVVDIAGTITKIRHQRMKMVQTPDQYVFLHDAILESVRCGDTQIAAANLRVILHKHEKKDPQTGINTYQSQFDVLDQVSPKTSEVVCTAASRNPEKNRNTRYLPSDRFRVIIKGETEDYIHAAFAHGYKQQKAYIVAENPMASTVPNMLKVLYNRKIGAMVMLSALEEDGQEACARYWPNLNQVTKIGDFEVDLISEEILNGFTIRNISILHEKSRKAHQVMQFHITCWQPDGQCSNLRSVVDTIEEIAKVQRKTGNKPIFVHCNDTVTRSGMFCVLATVIDRCKTEGVVDVFQVVKALRIQKPGAVPTVHNFRMIFEATLTFLDSFDTYANFQN